MVVPSKLACFEKSLEVSQGIENWLSYQICSDQKISKQSSQLVSDVRKLEMS